MGNIGPTLAKFLMKAKAMAEPVAEGAMAMGKRGMGAMDSMGGSKAGILGLLAGGAGGAMMGGDDQDDQSDTVMQDDGTEDPEMQDIEDLLRRHSERHGMNG